jgi:hypothetical protein
MMALLPLLIIFLWALRHNAFLRQRMGGVAGWLRRFLQADTEKSNNKQ